MSTTLTAICSAPGTGCVMRSRRANARRALAGRKRAGERDTQVAPSPRAGEAERWQRILDLLNPGRRCGVWPPATSGGRPVVCTRAPTTLPRSTQTPKPGGASTTKSPEAIPYGAPRTQDAQALRVRSVSGVYQSPPAGRAALTDARQQKEGH